MAKNDKEVNVDKAWYLFKNIIDNTKRNDALKEAYANAKSIEDKAKILKHAKVNREQLEFAKKEINSLKEYGTVGMGKVFHEFGKKMIAEEGQEGAKALLKRVGKHLPGAGALAGIMTAFATHDASAAIPVLNEADPVGYEKGTEGYKLESGDSSIKMQPEDVQAQADEINRANKAKYHVSEPQITAPASVKKETLVGPEVRTESEREIAAAEGAIMNDEKADQTLKGIETEKEHTDKPKVALKIAQDHLKEDPRYYDHLASMEMENPQSGNNENIHATGGFVDGNEDEYAGDKIDAKLNKGEMVLNVEQQQKLIDKLNGRESNIPEGERIDKRINKREIDLKSNIQKQLFDFINDKDKKPQGKIIEKHYEDGGIPLDPTQAAPNTLDTALTAPVVPEAPVAPTPAPEVPQSAQLPESMRYTGPGSTPVAAPEQKLPEAAQYTGAPIAPPIIEPSKEEVDAEAQKLRQAQAQTQAQAAQLENKVKDTENKTFKIGEQLKKEDKDVEDAPIKSLFERATTGQKILAGIAIAMGSIGAAMTKSGRNYAAEIIQKAIDTDLDAQKLNKEQKLAKKEFALKQAKLQIEKTAASLDNQVSKLKLQQLSGEIQAQKDAIGLQRLKMKQMQAGGEIDPSLLTDEERQLSVIDPKTGKRYIATAGTKESVQKVRDYQAEVVPALQSIKKIREMGKEGMALPFTERAARVNTEMQALIGNLRLPITGPGILTDSERQMLAKIIGNPTAVLSFKNVENAKLDQIENKLKGAMKAQYNNVGIKVPESKNEARINQLRSKYKGLSEGQAEAALKRTNLWDTEE